MHAAAFLLLPGAGATRARAAGGGEAGKGIESGFCIVNPQVLVALVSWTSQQISWFGVGQKRNRCRSSHSPYLAEDGLPRDLAQALALLKRLALMDTPEAARLAPQWATLRQLHRKRSKEATCGCL